MNFIKRIGTEKHSYLVTVVVQHLFTEYEFDRETMFKVQLRRGLFFSLANHKSETKSSSIVQNKKAIFQPQQLQIPVTMYYDVASKIYQEKKAELRVILIRKEIKKKVGNIQIDISEYLNKCQMHREEKRNLDNCPQKSTILQFQIFLKETENLSSSSKQEKRSIVNSLVSSEIRPKMEWHTQEKKQLNLEKGQFKNKKKVNLIKQRQNQSYKMFLNFEQEDDEMGWNYQKKIIYLEEQLRRKQNEINELKKREIEIIQKVTQLESQNKKLLQKEKEWNKKDQKKQQTRQNVQNKRLLQIQQQKYRKLQHMFYQQTQEYNKVNNLLKQKEKDLNDKEERLDKLIKNNDANDFQKSEFLKRIDELEQELFMAKKSRAEAVQAALQKGNFEFIQFLQQFMF